MHYLPKGGKKENIVPNYKQVTLLYIFLILYQHLVVSIWGACPCRFTRNIPVTLAINHPHLMWIAPIDHSEKYVVLHNLPKLKGYCLKCAKFPYLISQIHPTV